MTTLKVDTQKTRLKTRLPLKEQGCWSGGHLDGAGGACLVSTHLVKELLPCSVGMEGKLQLRVHGRDAHVDLHSKKACEVWGGHLKRILK